MNRKLLLYFGHPAQFMMLRQSIKILKQKDWQIKIIIKTKDVLETLLKDSGFEYQNILQQVRSDNLFSIFTAVLKRDIKMLRIVRKFRPDLMVGTDPSIAHIGWLLNIPAITIVEDDHMVIKNLVRLTYPFTTNILCPEVCQVGKYDKKKIGYAGYMKLGYLHPKVFTVNEEITKSYQLPDRFVLIRLSALNAYHDKGIGGIDSQILDKILNICLLNDYEVKISSEFALEERYEKFRLKIRIVDMHHVLYAATLLVSDSQSMSVEASVLGIPNIRFSGFAGRISVLEELEHKYDLSFGIPANQKEELFRKLENLLQEQNLKDKFREKKEKMLAEKINLTAFLSWFIEDYPQSVHKLETDKEFQFNFR